MTLRTKIRPPFVFVIVALIAYGLSRVMPALEFPAQSIVAVALAVLGFGAVASALVSFQRNNTSKNPRNPEEATALVTSGMYRITRNPMYLGLALLLTGLCVYLGVWVGVIVLPAFVAYITVFQIAPEEEAMAKLFGEAYADYRARVRRWI